MEVYGQTEAPEIDLTAVRGMKIAMFVGSLDRLATVEDNRELREKLEGGANIVFYREYELGHLSFVLAKDMTWFKEDVVRILKLHATS